MGFDPAIRNIISAFHDTIAYYDNKNANQTVTITNSNLSDAFQLPPPSSSTTRSMKNNNTGYWISDGLRFALQDYGDRIVEVFVADASTLPPLPPGQQYLTARRVLTELSHCNYTALTLSSSARDGMSLLYLVTMLVIVFTLLSVFIMPASLCCGGNLLLWIVLFPMVLFWLAYNMSPLCWPMLPPTFLRDTASELRTLVPTAFEAPQFLVRPDCTVRGLRSDGVYDPAYCYRTCAEAPFLLQSWQEPAAWWLCDLFGVAFCRYVAAQPLLLRPWPGLVDSIGYFAQVIEFEAQDPDFTAAHRLCAFFELYQLVFTLISFALVVLLLPAVVVAIAEILGGAFVLLMQASASEAAQSTSGV